VKIQTVDSMTSRVDCFRPKTIRSLVLINHGSCGFNESSILPLYNPILLWSVWDVELMTNAFLFLLLFFNSISYFTFISLFLLFIYIYFLLYFFPFPFLYSFLFIIFPINILIVQDAM
jgi:hypothetical protein